MNDFTASNGVRVRVAPSENAHHPLEVMSMGLLRSSVDALREFFQAEADERLGRWRSAKNPVWTAVVQDGSGVVLFRHDDGQREFSVESRETQLHRWSPELREVAREYFDAHPEPKPWHDAALGDVWEFEIPIFFDPFAAVYQETTRGKEWIATRTGVPVDLSGVSKARQVWPEASNGD